MAAPTDAGPDVAPPEDDPGRRRLGWVGLAVAAASFISGLFAASLLGALYGLARGLDQGEARLDFGFAVVTSAGLWVGFLVLPLLWSRLAQSRDGGGGDGARSPLGLSARWLDLPLGVIVGLGSTLLTGLVSSVVLTSGQQDELEEKAREVIDRAQGPAAVILLVVVLCVVTPVAEEVFFRGLLFGSLRRIARPGAGAGLVLALLVASLVFGAVHYDFEPAPGRVLLVQIGMLGLFGLALSVLVLRTGRLAASIVAHATFNAVTVVTLLALR